MHDRVACCMQGVCASLLSDVITQMWHKRLTSAESNAASQVGILYWMSYLLPTVSCTVLCLTLCCTIQLIALLQSLKQDISLIGRCVPKIFAELQTPELDTVRVTVLVGLQYGEAALSVCCMASLCGISDKDDQASQLQTSVECLWHCWSHTASDTTCITKKIRSVMCNIKLWQRHYNTRLSLSRNPKAASTSAHSQSHSKIDGTVSAPDYMVAAMTPRQP